MSKEDIDETHKKVITILNEEFEASKDYVPQRRDWLAAYWQGFKSPEQLSRIRNTGYLYFDLCLPSFSFVEIFLCIELLHDAGLSRRS